MSIKVKDLFGEINNAPLDLSPICMKGRTSSLTVTPSPPCSLSHQFVKSATMTNHHRKSPKRTKEKNVVESSPSTLLPLFAMPRIISFHSCGKDKDTPLQSESSNLIPKSALETTPDTNDFRNVSTDHSYYRSYDITISNARSLQRIRKTCLIIMAAVLVALLFLELDSPRSILTMTSILISTTGVITTTTQAPSIPSTATINWNWTRRIKEKKTKASKKSKSKKEKDDDDGELIMPTPDKNTSKEQLEEIVEIDDTDAREVTIPTAYKRCPYVIDVFEQENQGISDTDFLRTKYLTQSTDMNVFYRATCLLFWKDFAAGHWADSQNRSIHLDDMVLLEKAKYEDGSSMSPMSTWTWITGDQHLSNFGAWKNRGGEVVYSVNDFDQAAIYDFHMDVLRIAVSICNHGFTNGLSKTQVVEALEAFTYTYVKTVIDYVGGDKELLYELTPITSTGYLRDFLWDVQDESSQIKQLQKFTELGSDGIRRFIRNSDTRLQDVPHDVEMKIRAEMTSTRYGSSMMKMGWKVRGWDDDFFSVLDVVRRMGSGIGSYGVDRYYVLLKGHDMSLEEDQPNLKASVILDVKLEPESAVSQILDEVDALIKAWYGRIFQSEADRAAQAQRRLTSYTDPYVGFLEIDGKDFIVRQRSPYKSTFDLTKLTDSRAFNEFIEQIAAATATAHTRGTASKSPAQFKHVIKLLLAGDRNRRRWSELVASIALNYRDQVILDFDCFKEYVSKSFPIPKKN